MSKILSIKGVNKKEEVEKCLKQAAEAVKRGRVIIYPTDTVYGIGCNISSGRVDDVFNIKKRAIEKPLSVAFSDIGMAGDFTKLTGEQEDFIRENLNKPMTFIVEKRCDRISDVITAGGKSVGIRILGNCFIGDAIRYANLPIITTSANISENAAPWRFEDIGEIKNNKLVDLIIDGGICTYRKPSVVIDLTRKPYRIIRQ